MVSNIDSKGGGGVVIRIGYRDILIPSAQLSAFAEVLKQASIWQSIYKEGTTTYHCYPLTEKLEFEYIPDAMMRIAQLAGKPV